jgi:hypothetical protein
VPDHGGVSANPYDALPIRLNVDDSDSPANVIDALILGRFATGEDQFVRILDAAGRVVVEVPCHGLSGANASVRLMR